MKLRQIKFLLLFFLIIFVVAAILFGAAYVKFRNYSECRAFKHSIIYCVTK